MTLVNSFEIGYSTILRLDTASSDPVIRFRSINDAPGDLSSVAVWGDEVLFVMDPDAANLPMSTGEESSR